MSNVSSSKPWSNQFRSSFQEIEINPLEEGATTLMYACQQENLDQLQAILRKRPEAVKDRDRTLKTVLHYCAENAALQCAEMVLNAAPDLLDAADEDGYTTLHLAVIAGNVALVNFLISKSADINKLDIEHHSVIHWATVCGEIELLELLLKCGANPSTPDVHGGYPVHYAAQMCGAGSEMGNDSRIGLAVLQILLSHHVHVNVVDLDERQPLLWAASAGSSDAVLALINNGASITARDKDGLTALHCAASRGHTDCLETLVELCGADVDVMDNNGCTALFYSVTLGHADATQLLLGYGANPNRQDRKGRTASHCGAAKSQLETLRILNKRGANLWARNVKGDYPLHEAVNSGRKELVYWLLSQRPDSVNSSNTDGRCPLHIAAINNNVEMCKILLDHQSLVNPVMRTSKGEMMTPLDAALHRSNRGCAKYLQLHGGVPASKLTSFAAALRGPHRVESHSDHHVTPDIRIDSPVKSRATRSLNTSPHSSYHSSKSKKVQVHIRADVSSETIEKKRFGKEEEDTKYKMKKQRTKTEIHYEDPSGGEKENHNISSNLKKESRSKYTNDTKKVRKDLDAANSDYSDYSSESDYRKKRRHLYKNKNRRKRNEDQRRKVSEKKSMKQKTFSDYYDESDSSEPMQEKQTVQERKSRVDGKVKSANPIHQTVTAIVHREDETENHPTPQSESNQKTKDDTIKHSENEEKTDSTGMESIQYQKLETDTDTIWEANFETGTPELAEPKPKSDQEKLPEPVKNTEDNSKEPEPNGTQFKDETDVFGEKPFDDQVKKQNDDELDFTVKQPEDIQDTTLKNEEVVDDGAKKETDLHVQNAIDEEREKTEHEGAEEKEESPQGVSFIAKTDDKGAELNKDESTEDRNNEANDKIPQEDVDRKNTEKILAVAEPKAERGILKEQGEITKRQSVTIMDEKTKTNVDDTVGKESEEVINQSNVDKGLVCIFPDNDSDEEVSPRKIQSPITRSRSASRKRTKSTYNQRRSRSSFEVLSDDASSENIHHASSQLGHQEDSGFEPSPRHINNSSQEVSVRNRSRIPRAKRNCVSSNKNDNPKEEEPNINVTSVTQAVQNSMRKFHLERRIFNTLLELKRLQIRAGKSNEQVAVKRLVDNYQRAGLIVGLQQYDGSYSFRHFERYLYDQLRVIQVTDKKLIPRLSSSNDFERLTKALKRTKAGKTLLETVPDNPLFCTHGTHRCIHATHAYTGIPCAAYISRINHHEFPKENEEETRCFLPRIDIKSDRQKQSLDAAEKSLHNVDPSKPVTLELIHGSEKQIISLPTEKLDKNRRYYVTFTIKGNNKEQKNSLTKRRSTKSS